MQITHDIFLPHTEIEMYGIRAQGSGGQNVNKVSTAIHLRFDVRSSSLPDDLKNRLFRLADQRLNRNGLIIIKAQRYRTQDMNRIDALARLRELLVRASLEQKKRIQTRPTRGSVERRIQNKSERGRIKRLRGLITDK